MMTIPDTTTEAALAVVLEDSVVAAQEALAEEAADTPAVVAQAAAGKAIKTSLAPIGTTPQALVAQNSATNEIVESGKLFYTRR